MTRDEALAGTDLADLLESIGAERGLQRRHHAYPCPNAEHSQTGDTPPTSISPKPEGYDVWKCHSCEAGGTAIDALLLSGRARDLPDALEQIGASREPARPPVPPRPARTVAEYVYTDEAGRPLIRVKRLEPKRFLQERWEDGRWQFGLNGTRRVLYRLPEVKAAFDRGEVVFVVEGEKDADRLRAEGKTATCNPMGAGKWTDEYVDQLAGASHRLVVIGDDDPPDPKRNGRREGHVHAMNVWRSLVGKVGQVVARLPAEGFKDVSDQLDAGVEFTSRSLRPVPALADSPSSVNGNGDRKGALMMTARAMAARPAPDRALQVVGPLIQRGMRTTIGAQTGEGKTTLALQAIKSLVTRTSFLDDSWVPPIPGRALIVDLEQGEETLKTRLRQAGLDQTDAVDVLWQPAGLALDSDPADQALLHDTIRDGGYDLVLVDPLYQMHRGNANDERVAADLMRVVDAWARDYNCALVIPMHARKPHPEAGKKMTIHDIAGSGTWNRNAEFVIGLQLMSSGTSRMWFFKDRIGLGPTIQSHWFLSFDRQAGFDRNHLEDREAVRRQLRQMLERDEGASRDELLTVADEHTVQGVLSRRRNPMHEKDGRYRSRPWTEQATLM